MSAMQSPDTFKYEQFLDTLENELVDVQNALKLMDAQSVSNDKLRVFLNEMKNMALGSKPLTVQTDLGCNFFVQAEMEKTDRVNIFCGLGLYLEMTIDEALNFIDKRNRILEMRRHQLLDQENKITTTSKLILQGLRELQTLS